MRSWAEINYYTNFVIHVVIFENNMFDYSQNVALPIYVIEVTNMTPLPKEGDYYNGVEFIYADDLINSVTIDKTIDDDGFVNMAGNGIDTTIVSNIFTDTNIKVLNAYNEILYEETNVSGVFDFTVDTPGKYSVVLSLFPYKELRYSINAS